MKSFKRNRYLFIALAFLLSACGGGGSDSGIPGNSNTPTHTANYYPVTVGSKWTYSITSANSTPSTWSSEITQGGAASYSMKITTASSGYSVIDAALTNGAWGVTKSVSYDPSGAVLSTITYSPPQLLFPSKTDIGTHETTTSTLTSGGNNSQATIDITVDGIESVTVPAGTFANALKLTSKTTMSGSTASVSAWYADGAGFVKSEDTYGGTQELTSYTIR